MEINSAKKNVKLFVEQLSAIVAEIAYIAMLMTIVMAVLTTDG